MEKKLYEAKDSRLATYDRRRSGVNEINFWSMIYSWRDLDFFRHASGYLYRLARELLSWAALH